MDTVGSTSVDEDEDEDTDDDVVVFAVDDVAVDAGRLERWKVSVAKSRQ